MRMNVTASAPGKVVVLGEYAVLEGAPALSTAVNRRASVQVHGTWNQGIQVHSPDMQGEPAQVCVAAEGLQWNRSEDRDRLPLVDAILGQVLADPVHRQLRTSFQLKLDTSGFRAAGEGTPRKLGLGSSAALTVACVSAVAAHVDGQGAAQGGARWLDRSLEIHRAFQGGQGSGVDVATSLLGRTIIYRRSKTLVPRVPRWPQSLHYRFVWTGRASSTTAKLLQLEAWRKQHPADHKAHMAALCALAESGAAAFHSSDAAGLIGVAQAYAQALGKLDAASGLGIASEEHRRLARLGESAGVAYKSCGAGGGDVGIALTLDPDRLIHFDADLVREGFQPLPLTVDEPGLRLDLAPASTR